MSIVGQAVLLRQIVLWFYLFTFIFGIAGNGLVIYIIAYYKSVRTKSVANYYIWNLSFADLFFILTLPFFCYSTFYQEWPFGWILCKLSMVIFETNKFASVFTLVALSVDRYLASFYNLGNLRTVKVGKLVCLCIWLLCLAISTPYWTFARTVHKLPYNNTVCTYVYPEKNQLHYSMANVYFQFTIGLLVPFGLIFGSYILLARRLKDLLHSSAARHSSRISKPSRKMTKTVLMVVIIFLICQLPHHAQQIMRVEQQERVEAHKARGQHYKATHYEIYLFQYMNAVTQNLGLRLQLLQPFHLRTAQ